MWPAARLTLLPFLLYLLGQYLEGPSYRTIVHGIPFVLVSFGIVILSAQYLGERTRRQFKVTFLPLLFLPAAFVYAIQRHFDGSANPPVSFAVFITSLLMFLCGLVYLRSLAAAWDTSLPTTTATPHQPATQADEAGSDDAGLPGNDSGVAHYDIRLYRLDHQGRRSSLIQQESGHGELPRAFLLDGYSETQCIDLDPGWADVLSHRIELYRTHVATYETIEKFGETQQLVNEYELVFEVKFADDHS